MANQLSLSVCLSVSVYAFEYLSDVVCRAHFGYGQCSAFTVYTVVAKLEQSIIKFMKVQKSLGNNTFRKSSKKFECLTSSVRILI